MKITTLISRILYAPVFLGNMAACDGTDGNVVDQIALPGSAFFPESINVASDGTLYVSSLADGSVARISPDRANVTTFLDAQTSQPIGKAGMLLDEAKGRFWVCQVSNDFSQASTLDAYDLATGTRVESHALAMAGGVCNDLAIDAGGNLYITDSFFGIERLANGAAAAVPLAVWQSDPLYQPATQGSFGIDGIAIDNNNVFTNNAENGTLVRTPIANDGSAGAPVAIAGVSLSSTDGLRRLAANTLVVTESSIGTITKVIIDPATDSGVRTVLSDQLDRPSAIAIFGTDAWVADGQISRLLGFDTTPVQVPFLVERVSL